MESRNVLQGKIVNLRRGLAIYRVKASPYYRVRVWIPSQKKRIVRTTKTNDRAEAIAIAEEFLNTLGTRGILNEVPQSRTFETFADKLLLNEKARGERGEISRRLWTVTKVLPQPQALGGTTPIREYRHHNHPNQTLPPVPRLGSGAGLVTDSCDTESHRKRVRQGDEACASGGR